MLPLNRTDVRAHIATADYEGDMENMFDGYGVESQIEMTSASSYVPLAIQTRITQTFMLTWFRAFRVASAIFQAGNIPTLDQLSLGAPDLPNGFKLEYVLDALAHIAYESSELGDGEFESHNEGYDRILSCENDLTFVLVRRKLGLDPCLQWGPCAASVDNEEMDEIRNSILKLFNRHT